MPIKDPIKRKQYQKEWLAQYYSSAKKKKIGGDGHVKVQNNYNKKGDAKFLAALATFKKYG